jgi:hypothetical protein
MAVANNDREEIERPGGDPEAELEDEPALDELEDDEEPDEDEEPEEVVAVPDEDEESDSASLDALLAQRAAARRGTDDADDDEDIMSLASQRDEALREPLVSRVSPIRNRQEFVCNRCHLVKAKTQLADPQRGLCRDCV